MKIKLLFTSLFLMLMSFATFAQNEKEPYVVLKDGTVTFYYNDSKPEGFLPIQTSWNGWTEDDRFSVKKVVFDASFKEYEPTSCAFWFMRFVYLTEISGMKENLNTDNVSSMQAMFEDCGSLTTLDLSNFNTANVTNMESMFSGCSRLTTLDLSNFNTETVTDMETMFSRCSGLTTLDLSHFNTEKVTNMDGMFLLCHGLTSLNLSNFNTANVTTMRRMFEDCSKLTTLDLSNFNTANVTNMVWMFEGCSSLKSIFVDDGWITTSVNAYVDMFAGCAKLYGGKGTHCEESDIKYAHVDGGAENPGYFTKSGELAFTTPVSDITDTQSGIKVWSSNSSIFIASAPDAKYKIIDLNGRILTTSTTKSSKEEIHIGKQGVYVVLVNGESFKVAIQ